ncbi:MAG: amidohydrolase family protein [Patescibacteria group bacterium]
MATKRFPGFIDPHVHLRDPGATQKEDFATGTRAALAGGFTFVCDMPNNPTPTVSLERLQEKERLAEEKAACGLGFHYGTDGRNLESFVAAAKDPHVFGLKIYLNHTTGEMLIEDVAVLRRIFEAWPAAKPVLVHAEGVQLAAALSLAHYYDKRLHVCHISQAVEVELVRAAKRKGQAVTAGACPHHLFLTGKARETHGPQAIMKPPLAEQGDQDALWEGLADRTIDLVETDHAPHTLEEKQGDPPPFGVPGLETAAPLLWKAVRDGKLAADDVPRLLHDAAREIFAIPEQPDTYVELDPDEPYEIDPAAFQSKAKWSPFDGWTACGKPRTVVLHGKTVVEDGRLVS